MEKLTLVGEWILGEIIEQEEKSEGGVILPKTMKNPMKHETKRARILGIGNKVKEPKFKVGDEVVIYFEAGLKCEKFGTLFKEGNIMAVIQKEEADA